MYKSIFKKLSSISLASRLLKHVGTKQKIKLLLLLFHLLLATAAEIFSISAIVPFLKSLTDLEAYKKVEILGFKIQEFYFIREEYFTFYITCIFAFSILVASLIRISYYYFSFEILQEITRSLSTKAYKNLILQPYETLKGIDKNSLYSSLTSEMVKVSDLLVHIIQLIASAIIFCGIAITLLRFDTKIAITIGFTTGIAYLIIGNFVKRILSLNSQKIRKATISQFGILQESLGSIKDLIINKNFNFFINLYSKNEIPLRKLNANNAFITTFPRFLIESISIIILIFVALYLYRTEDEFSNIISKIGFLALACQRLIPSAQHFFASWASIKSQSSATTSILDILNIKRKKVPIFKKSALFKNWKTVNIKNLNFNYKDEKKRVLSNFNYTINRNSSLGIYGKSGSGKSTFSDLLMCLLEPSSGFIQIDNKIIDPKKVNHEKLKQAWQDQISHAPQESFFIDASFLENIALGEEPEKININRVMNCAKIARIEDFILSNSKGYNHKIIEGGRNLSGGQKQRLNIARALYKKHSVLLLDEPTSALDRKTSDEVINNLFAVKNVTIIIISHDMNIINQCEKKLYL